MGPGKGDLQEKRLLPVVPLDEVHRHLARPVRGVEFLREHVHLGAVIVPADARGVGIQIRGLVLEPLMVVADEPLCLSPT